MLNPGSTCLKQSPYWRKPLSASVVHPLQKPGFSHQSHQEEKHRLITWQRGNTLSFAVSCFVYAQVKNHSDLLSHPTAYTGNAHQKRSRLHSNALTHAHG